MDQPPQPNQPPESLKPSLPVEETPIIEPPEESVQRLEPESSTHPAEAPISHSSTKPDIYPPKPRNQSGCAKGVANVIFFLLLFALGAWLSTQIRPRVGLPIPRDAAIITPQPADTIRDETTAPDDTRSADTNEAWTSYPLGADSGDKGVAGAAYQLPNAVVAPVCDGASCISRGTYLPGGTRLTVALRGTGYKLPDFRGAILTDSAGKEFTMKQTTVGGKDVYEYTGTFAGRTLGGYTFSRMRGVLVPMTDTTSVDFNHFAPTGITSDFDTDDALFNQIVARLVIPSTTK